MAGAVLDVPATPCLWDGGALYVQPGVNTGAAIKVFEQLAHGANLAPLESVSAFECLRQSRPVHHLLLCCWRRSVLFVCAHGRSRRMALVLSIRSGSSSAQLVVPAVHLQSPGCSMSLCISSFEIAVGLLLLPQTHVSVDCQCNTMFVAVQSATGFRVSPCAEAPAAAVSSMPTCSVCRSCCDSASCSPMQN